MKFSSIARILGTDYPISASDPDISDLAYDSSAVTPGSLFFCLAGESADGHDFAPEAVRKGAAGLITTRPLDLGVPEIRVANSRDAMGRVAAPFYGDPTRRLRTVGITGTNGKTTVAYLLDSMFRAAGDPGGMVGTVVNRIAGRETFGSRTTPESVDLQRLFSQILEAGAFRCAVEVTSIGLAEGRTAGTHFEVAVFTNLTRDHLDYHKDMESYFLAKKSLFGSKDLRLSVINIDDPFGDRLAKELAGPSLTYGLDSSAEIRARDISMDGEAITFRCEGIGTDNVFKLNILGRFNISNALGAIGAAHAMEIPPASMIEGIARVGSIPGRMEEVFVETAGGRRVFVDYAHTPDGLAQVLLSAREIARDANVIVVFGCGGDRDRAKRALMGQAAAANADRVVATSDNPRSEDPAVILGEIEEGIKRSEPRLGYLIEPDRRTAIAAGIHAAKAGDVVVIAGKGHERKQHIGGVAIDFEDAKVASEILGALE